MGMRTLAIDSEAVERRRERRREISVRAAAGKRILEIEANIRGERARVFVQCGAGVAFLIRRAVQLPAHPHVDAFGARRYVQDPCDKLLSVGYRRDPQVDLRISLLWNHVWFGAAADHT